MGKNFFNKFNEANYQSLARKIAWRIENRDYKFNIVYGCINENEIIRDIEKAFSFLDTISPYAYQNIKKHYCYYQIGKDNVVIEFEVKYHTSIRDEQYLDRQIESIADGLRNSNQTDYEIVKAVHDYLVKNYRYSEKTENSPYIPFTMILEKKGVCQAFALLAVRLYKALAIPCLYVTGYANGGRHGWNVVQVDGQWYHLDITWDNPNGDSYNTSNILYDYFLLSDEQIKIDHDFDPYYYPTCPNQYRNENLIYDDYTQLDDYIVYSNPVDNHKLYIVNAKENTKNPQKLLDVRASSLSSHFLKVYFSNNSDSGRLYSYDLQTKKCHKMTSFKIIDTRVDKSYLYVKDVNGITKRLKLD